MDVEPPFLDKEHAISMLNRYVPLDTVKRMSREKTFFEVPAVGIALFLFKGLFAFFGLYLMDDIGLKVIVSQRLELYRKITIVTQEIILFNETVRDNIA